jgi:hypothetical protein
LLFLSFYDSPVSSHSGKRLAEYVPWSLILSLPTSLH